MKTAFPQLKVALSTLIVWLAFSSAPALAQKLDIGGDFLMGLPQNAFRDNVREKGFGFSGHIGYFIGDSPIMVGADIGYLNYGTEKHWEPLSETIPEVSVEVRTTNNIFMLHGFARVQQQEGSVRPYVEGLYGFKYLFTRTSIKDGWYNETIAAATNLSDLAGSWGVGTGVDIRLWEGQRRGGAYDISLNLSAKYLWGAKAEYLKKGSIISNPDGSISYLVLRSTTDMLQPQIGVRIRF